MNGTMASRAKYARQFAKPTDSFPPPPVGFVGPADSLQQSRPKPRPPKAVINWRSPTK
jgi:hypothetical protein